MTIYTFSYFWQVFHEVTKQPKLKKALSQHLWDKTIDLDLKKSAIKSIHKDIKIDAYLYLKHAFKHVKRDVII